jgi:hypothetical protein
MECNIHILRQSTQEYLLSSIGFIIYNQTMNTLKFLYEEEYVTITLLNA